MGRRYTLLLLFCLGLLLLLGIPYALFYGGIALFHGLTRVGPPTSIIVAQADKSYRIILTFRVDGERVDVGNVVRSTFNVSQSSENTDFQAGQFLFADATRIDLPGRPTLYALLRPTSHQWRYFGRVFLDACNLKPQPDETPDGWISRVSAFGGECPLAPDMLPLVISITDTTSRRGATLVDLTSDPSFLGGRLQVTDAAPTEAIQSHLPYLIRLAFDLEVPRTIDPSGSIVIGQSEFFWRHHQYRDS